MNVVIIEDEVAAYDNIRHILLETDPKINILAHLDSVEDSVSWFQGYLHDGLRSVRYPGFSGEQRGLSAKANHF